MNKMYVTDDAWRQHIKEIVYVVVAMEKGTHPGRKGEERKRKSHDDYLCTTMSKTITQHQNVRDPILVRAPSVSAEEATEAEGEVADGVVEARWLTVCVSHPPSR